MGEGLRFDLMMAKSRIADDNKPRLDMKPLDVKNVFVIVILRTLYRDPRYTLLQRNGINGITARQVWDCSYRSCKLPPWQPRNNKCAL